MSKTFKVASGKLVISDPCYTLGTWCQGVVNAKNGTWDTMVTLEGGRIKSISAWNIEAAMDNFNLPQEVLSSAELPFVCGVDSGQLGYFDHYQYRIDESVNGLKPYNFNEFNQTGEPGDLFYRVCCGLTLSNDQYGVIPYGLVSASGWGDGSYTTKGIKDNTGDYIALSTTFIEDDHDDQDQYEDDEESENTDI